MYHQNIGIKAGRVDMGIIDSFKKQSKIMQVLNIIFIICILYGIITLALSMPFNGAITILTGILLWIHIFKYILHWPN